MKYDFLKYDWPPWQRDESMEDRALALKASAQSDIITSHISLSKVNHMASQNWESVILPHAQKGKTRNIDDYR